MLRGNFRALDDHAQVPLAKYAPFGQANFERAQRTVAVIFEFIGDVKMDARRGRAGNQNFRLAIGKLVARAEGLDAAGREKCAGAQGGGKKIWREWFHLQVEVILPVRRFPVKSCCSAFCGAGGTPAPRNAGISRAACSFAGTDLG